MSGVVRRWTLVALMLLVISPLDRSEAAPQRSSHVTEDSGDGDSVIFPAQICALDECNCEVRKRHSKVAMCRCTRTLLRLRPAMMAGGDVTELAVSATQHCPGVVIEEGTFISSSIKRVSIAGPAKVVIEARSFQISAKQRNFSLLIEGAKELKIGAHAFSGKLSSITFANITNSMRIVGKTFLNMHGQQTSVAFHNVTIDDVMSSAFSGVRLRTLSFSNSSISQLSSGAIRRSYVHTLRLDGCRLQRVETGAASGSRMQDVQLRHNTIGEVEPGALQLALDGTAELTGNQLHQLRDGAFTELRPDKPDARVEFHNNTVESVEEGGLSFSELLQPRQLAVSQLTTRRRCSCGLLDWLQLLARRPQLAERLAAVATCVGPEGPATIGPYVRQACSSAFDDGTERGGSGGGSGGDGISGRRRTAVLAGAAVAVLFGTSCVTGLVCWQLGRRRRRRRQRHKAQANVLDHRPHKLNNANMFGGEGGGWRLSHPPARADRPALVVAVPDVKTYTETEVQVVLESLEIMPEGPVCPPTPPETEPAPGCRKSCPL